MPTLDKQLLDRIRNNDPSLTELNFYGNRIGVECQRLQSGTERQSHLNFNVSSK